MLHPHLRLAAGEGDEKPSYQIIELFDPNGAQHTELITSLDRLEKKTGLNLETIRHAIEWLVKQGDFTVNLDVSRAEFHKVFTLTVDWEKFSANRIQIYKD